MERNARQRDPLWGTGIGVDAKGNLIYAAADDQTAASLAKTLIRGGAVGRMQLNINSFRVTFISYGQERGWRSEQPPPLEGPGLPLTGAPCLTNAPDTGRSGLRVAVRRGRIATKIRTSFSSKLGQR